MSILKYKNYLILFSILGIAGSLGVTFGVHHGFARSISFNGGIRLTVMLPEGKERDFVEKAAQASGLDVPVIRLTDVRANKYDIEFGPDVRDRFQKQVDEFNRAEREKKDAADRAQREQMKKQGDVETGVKGIFQERTVAGEIEKVLLPHLGVGAESVISREVISASYGTNLLMMSMKALFFSIALITVYITFRFDFSYALGAMVALLHDLIFTVGYIGVMQIQPSVPVVAAVLTLLGYSMNDTVIIFDRIRASVRDRTDLASSSILDHAILTTLNRTTLTSFLTMLSIVAILVSGAESLRDFAEVLIFGIIIGTYSSIFVASPVVQLYEKLRLKRHAA